MELDDENLPLLPITFEDIPIYPRYYKVWPSVASIHVYLNKQKQQKGELPLL